MVLCSLRVIEVFRLGISYYLILTEIERDTVRVWGCSGREEPAVEDSSSLLCALRATPLCWDLGGPGISPTETNNTFYDFCK